LKFEDYDYKLYLFNALSYHKDQTSNFKIQSFIVPLQAVIIHQQQENYVKAEKIHPSGE
jgi:hypothetical protein